MRKKDERILIQACIDQLSVACMPVAVRRKEEREKERKLEAEGKPVALKLQPGFQSQRNLGFQGRRHEAEAFEIGMSKPMAA